MGSWWRCADPFGFKAMARAVAHAFVPRLGCDPVAIVGPRLQEETDREGRALVEGFLFVAGYELREPFLVEVINSGDVQAAMPEVRMHGAIGPIAGMPCGPVEHFTVQRGGVRVEGIAQLADDRRRVGGKLTGGNVR
jgi:hypothetical protein